MEKNSPDAKRIAVFIIMTAVCVLIYAVSGQGKIFVTAAQVLSMASLIVFSIHNSPRIRVFFSAVLIVFMTAAGLFVCADLADAALFTLSFALPGLCMGVGMAKKRAFTEYMLFAAAVLILVNILSIYHELTVLGLQITTDSAIDYLMAPAFDMVSQYASLADASGNADTSAAYAIVRASAIGSFVSAMLLELFFAYAIAGGLNARLGLLRPGFFESLKLFNISRIGGILYLICAIVNLWTAGETPNVYAANLYAILRYPLALGGVATIYRFMSGRGVKNKTKRAVAAVVCVLTVLPVLNISPIISYIGALNAIIPFTMPKSGPPAKE
ncbi:MAG: DUF2232 domain-containing protein [Clostridia bacterium]|nr:DUF2232 domain-containing protein [Clostridia bacterium]